MSILLKIDFGKAISLEPLDRFVSSTNLTCISTVTVSDLAIKYDEIK